MDNLVIPRELKLYRGKRVFITGDTGFKGSWLCLWLHILGADVMGYALPPERDMDHFNLIGLSGIIRHVDGDIRDLPHLQGTLNEFSPEFLFHLAAQPLVRYSYQEPKLTFDTNVGGSVNVLEAARTLKSLRSLVYITSDKCYLNKEWIWGYRENDELGGRDPYSASKAAAEIVFSAYIDSFFNARKDLGAASVRAGNVIGGGDWAQDRIVPDSIKALQSGQPVILRNPSSTRPWQHVLEPLFGYLLLAAKLYEQPEKYLGAYNFGPRSESVKSVKDLAETIVSCWGDGKIVLSPQGGTPHEAGLLRLNSDKAHSLLGWRPIWDFNRTVTETALWYKELNEGMPALMISRRQITEYMEALI